MLDVIHYFYEEDLNFTSVEQSKIAEARRVAIYKHLYDTDYKYRTDGVSSSNADGSFGEDDIVPFDPSNAPVKPYIPPTQVDADFANPFGGVLDAPIN